MDQIVQLDPNFKNICYHTSRCPHQWYKRLVALNFDSISFGSKYLQYLVYIIQ